MTHHIKITKPPIDIPALRAEMDRLKLLPDVQAYHRAKAMLMGASGTGASKSRPQKKRDISAHT